MVDSKQLIFQHDNYETLAIRKLHRDIVCGDVSIKRRKASGFFAVVLNKLVLFAIFSLQKYLTKKCPFRKQTTSVLMLLAKLDFFMFGCAKHDLGSARLCSGMYINVSERFYVTFLVL